MPFGIIGWTGPGIRQVVGFEDQSMGRGTFGGEFGARHCNQWGLYGIRVDFCSNAAPLPKLLSADHHYYYIHLVTLHKSLEKVNHGSGQFEHTCVLSVTDELADRATASLLPSSCVR